MDISEDTYVPKITDIWFATQDSFQALHKSGTLTGPRWNSIVDLLYKTSLAMRAVWNIWAKSHTEVNKTMFMSDYDRYSLAKMLVAELHDTMSRFIREA